jgi:folate-binding protein YgfZ
MYYSERTRDHLLLTGRDRQSFLQGQVTNDILSLVPNQGCYAFQCDATGHVLSDMRVLCGENFLLLDIEPGFGPVVQANLEKHLVMERVKIAPYETKNFLLWGTDINHPSVSEFSLPEGYGETEEMLTAMTHIIPFPAMTVYATEKPAFLVEGPYQEISEEDIEILRIEAGIPRYGRDIDAKVLAPETGQAHRAIHYKKGCYIGQEIIARIDARGHTNRSFAGFFLPSIVPDNTPVTVGGKEVGRITSSCFSEIVQRHIGLGYIRNEHGDIGTILEVNGQEASIAPLPHRSHTQHYEK